MNKKDLFPDGTIIDEWFYDTTIPNLEFLGKQYVITEYGIKEDGRVYTQEIQALIDRIAEEGGGVLVVPEGTYYTGALFFKQGVNLYIKERGMLKGSDDISDYPVCFTRIEGQSCMYYPAIINADDVNGFVMCGEGTIDGNGSRAWKAFWQRRQWNPDCTNKDEQRPRLLFISNSSNVTIAGLRLQNSHFWTTHIYKCNHIRYIGCSIFAPNAPVPAPSSDAIDIDVCTDVLIKDCYIEVCDDAVVLKGGKGPDADKLPENGMNERILVEDCHFGYCHSCLTCGSESIHNKNILMRRLKLSGPDKLLWLKMRPDTPQHYEYVTIEHAEGFVRNFISIHPWTQFFDMKGKKEVPRSVADHITIRECNGECNCFFDVEKAADQYLLSDFTFENLDLKAENKHFDQSAVDNIVVNNIKL